MVKVVWLCGWRTVDPQGQYYRATNVRAQGRANREGHPEGVTRLLKWHDDTDDNIETRRKRSRTKAQRAIGRLEKYELPFVFW